MFRWRGVFYHLQYFIEQMNSQITLYKRIKLCQVTQSNSHCIQKTYKSRKRNFLNDVRQVILQASIVNFSEIILILLSNQKEQYIFKFAFNSILKQEMDQLNIIHKRGYLIHFNQQSQKHLYHHIRKQKPHIFLIKIQTTVMKKSFQFDLFFNFFPLFINYKLFTHLQYLTFYQSGIEIITKQYRLIYKLCMLRCKKHKVRATAKHLIERHLKISEDKLLKLIFQYSRKEEKNLKDGALD
ncbi:unnamed protein product (macronuclear) [Paramecium tetraurelia]|uniref:Uncharacterized protein n=1 Tax=Paramecium tetraurelia TaxID=5888 RepID=A0BL97_PARTE|nr:uncharacterized protein GSPATT00029946001 [Paramecium tetraurelia]CAK59314.1 unnamed protein product [Paramecium tetraurelia]|eukprot:XP_001426712.1 hypothetical protein (macronuclear) [Paramecium tetraurelia strain d4-2]